jgi:RHS repeat-associated protein
VIEVTGSPLPAGKLAYDANGAVVGVTGRSLRLESDAFSGLLTRAAIEGSAAAQVQLAYGPQQRRVRKVVSRGPAREVKQYLYGADERPLREQTRAGDGPPQNRQLIYGPHGLLAVEGPERLFLLQDHLGSTRVVLNGQGKPVAGYEYLPFGSLWRAHGPQAERLTQRYTGQEWDAELGLYNYRARMYDAELGRFYARDPLHEYASPYLYAGNNPLAFTDPTGMASLAAWLEGILGALVIIGGIALGAVTGGLGTAGAAAWAAAIFGGMASGALMGAGGAAIGYAVAHPDDNEGYKSAAFWNEVGIGAATGAVAGGLGRLGSQFATLAAEFMAVDPAVSVETALLSWGPRSIRLGSSLVGGLATGSFGSTLRGENYFDRQGASLWGALSSVLEAAMGEAVHYRGGRLGVRWHNPLPIRTTGAQLVRGLTGLVVGGGIGVGVNTLQNLGKGEAWDKNLGASMGIGAFIGVLTAAPRYLPGAYRDARAPSIEMVPERSRSLAV